MISARDDDFSQAGQLGERSSQFDRADDKNFGFLGLAPHAGQRGVAGQHGHIADEIARPRRGQDQFLAVPVFKSLQLAADDHGQAQVRVVPP